LSPRRLKMEIFPADDLSIDEIREWLAQLEREQLIEWYTAEGSDYFRVTGWARHQRIERPTYRYPQPDSAGYRRAFDEPSANGRRLLAEPSPSPRPRIGVEWSGLESIGVEGNGGDTCGETAEPSSPPPTDDAPLLTYPCDGRPTSWHLTPSQLAEWQALFPALCVLDECKAALAWIDANPAKRKTANGMKRFLASWLARSQNRPKPTGGTHAQSPPRVGPGQRYRD
jgi:hypothetical protein